MQPDRVLPCSVVAWVFLSLAIASTGMVQARELPAERIVVMPVVPVDLTIEESKLRWLQVHSATFISNLAAGLRQAGFSKVHSGKEVEDVINRVFEEASSGEAECDPEETQCEPQLSSKFQTDVFSLLRITADSETVTTITITVYRQQGEGGTTDTLEAKTDSCTQCNAADLSGKIKALASSMFADDDSATAVIPSPEPVEETEQSEASGTTGLEWSFTAFSYSLVYDAASSSLIHDPESTEPDEVEISNAILRLNWLFAQGDNFSLAAGGGFYTVTAIQTQEYSFFSAEEVELQSAWGVTLGAYFHDDARSSLGIGVDVHWIPTEFDDFILYGSRGDEYLFTPPASFTSLTLWLSFLRVLYIPSWGEGSVSGGGVGWAFDL